MSVMQVSSKKTPQELFISVFRQHPGGVAVLSTMSEEGPKGMTATSVISLNAEPPSLGFSLSSRSSSAPYLCRAETVIVHFLEDRHAELARRFAESGVDRFAEPTKWETLPSGEPLLRDVPVWLRVRIRDRVESAGSTFVIGEILEGGAEDSPHAPLIYLNRRFHALDEDSAVA